MSHEHECHIRRLAFQKHFRHLCLLVYLTYILPHLQISRSLGQVQSKNNNNKNKNKPCMVAHL
jgi:hypothetical protein